MNWSGWSGDSLKRGPVMNEPLLEIINELKEDPYWPHVTVHAGHLLADVLAALRWPEAASTLCLGWNPYAEVPSISEIRGQCCVSEAQVDDSPDLEGLPW